MDTQNGLTIIHEKLRIAEGEEPIPGWKITEKLGKGTFGSAWKIERSAGNLKLTEAVKVIRAFDHEPYQELRERELEAMLTLREHPNVVRCDNFFYAPVVTDEWEDNALLIQMEFLTSLDKCEPFADLFPEEEEVIRMGIDILTALDAMFRHNMIHRDIKPQNIFRSEYGIYKLGDYGLARTIEPENDLMLSACGTKPYMAPEMLIPNNIIEMLAGTAEYGQTVDTYALALVMYEYTNGGLLPFFENGFEEGMRMRLSGSEPIPAPQFASPELSRILLKALSFNPKDRFTSPMEFINALKSIKGSASQPLPRKTAKPTDSQTQTRRSVDQHRSRLESNIRETMHSSTLFLDEHLGKKG